VLIGGAKQITLITTKPNTNELESGTMFDGATPFDAHSELYSHLNQPLLKTISTR